MLALCSSFSFFLFFFFSIQFIIFLSSSFPPFFPCKTRSSTHLLTTPSRFPLSTTTCRVRPWLVPKVSVISTSDLYYYDGFSRSHFSIFFLYRCVGGCVAINSLLPLVFSDKMKKGGASVTAHLNVDVERVCMRAFSRA